MQAIGVGEGMRGFVAQNLKTAGRGAAVDLKHESFLEGLQARMR
jgi:hypothetical protein